MPRQVFSPNPERSPVGFSPATRAGDTVYVSGQVTLDEEGHLVGEGECGAQAGQVFRNVEAALEAAGATMDDLTKITAFLVNVDDYDAYAAVRADLFPKGGPASSTVIITELVRPDFLIEIEAIAYTK